MAGILIPLVAAGIGGAVDYSHAVSERANLQRALDKSAIAVALAEGEDSMRKSAGAASLHTNFGTPCGADPEYDITDAGVTGDVTCNVKTYILGIVGIATIPVSASTTIGFGDEGPVDAASPVCVYVFDPSSAGALTKGGGGTFNAPTCGIHINSRNATALSVGAGSMKVGHIHVVGGVNSSCESWRCKATPTTGVAPIADPMADFVAPPSEPCTHTNYYDRQAGNRTISPGIYCGGMNFAAGNTHFSPGVYVIRDGLLQQGGGGNWTGENVVFRFEGTGRINRGGGGDMTFTARTSGPYTGMVFFQAPSSEPGLQHDFGGGGGKKFEGTIYLPDHDMNLGGGGNRASAAPWTIWVVRRMNLGGGGDVFVRADFEASTVPLPEAFAKSGLLKRLLVIAK